MSSDESSNILAESSMTIPSDSEQYSGNDDISPSPLSSSNSPRMILYSPPTLWGLIRGAAINLLLPFINGMMLGFGELFAHEAAFRLGWGGTKVWEACLSGSTVLLYRGVVLGAGPTDSSRFALVFPATRSRRAVGPGIEVRDDPMERRRRAGGLNDMTSLE